MKTTPYFPFNCALVPLLVIATSLLPCKAAGQVNLVYNGGFEGGWSGGPVGWRWTVGVALNYNNRAFEGGGFINVFGTVFQDLRTIPGQHYHLQFAMSGNLQTREELIVHWGELTIGSQTWSPTNRVGNNLGWVSGSFDMFATASTTRLVFENPFGDINTAWVNLDAVRVEVVPEPSSAWLIGLCIIRAFSGARRHDYSNCMQRNRT